MKKQILSEEFLRMQKLAGLITESEFKRQVIKEKMVLKEALNKDIRQFAKDLGNYLTKDGFKVKYVEGNRIPDDVYTQLRTDTGLVAFVTDQNQDQQSLYLYFNPKENSKVEKIVNKFQLTPYSGKPMNAGWTRKQVVGALNPGDIFKVDGGQGMYQFFRLAKVNAKIKDV